ncbi:MAG: hypothetical protein IT384_18060 [Deltaproteobacteria bacterium]|nr:hypothetical protein [Deltaproteobacteria bacterium]
MIRRSMIRRSAICGLALSAACGGASDAPDVPVGTLSIGAGDLSGDVAVGFSLSDKESRLVNVDLRFGVGRADRPVTAAASAIGLRGLETSPGGTPYVFTWDSVTDLGYARTEAVMLSLELTAGAVAGIGDSAGPLVIDNSTLPRFANISGRICRAQMMFGTPIATTDHRGKLYVALYTDLRYPPLDQSSDGKDLGPQDLSSTATCVPYAFSRVSPGSYQAIAILDDNENNAGIGGYSVDRGDVTNVELGATPTATRIEVTGEDIQRDLFLNYYVP